MTAYFVLRTPSGPVRFRVNTEARDDESVLVREDEMPTMEWTMGKPTGRRVRCDVCGAVVAEVRDGDKGQTALHYVGAWVCQGAGRLSAHLQNEATP